MSVGGKRVRRRLSPHQECALRLARECLVLKRVSDLLEQRFEVYGVLRDVFVASRCANYRGLRVARFLLFG